jgi:hypothetical protein
MRCFGVWAEAVSVAVSARKRALNFGSASLESQQCPQATRGGLVGNNYSKSVFLNAWRERAHVSRGSAYLYVRYIRGVCARVFSAWATVQRMYMRVRFKSQSAKLRWHMMSIVWCQWWCARETQRTHALVYRTAAHMHDKTKKRTFLRVWHDQIRARLAVKQRVAAMKTRTKKWSKSIAMAAWCCVYGVKFLRAQVAARLQSVHVRAWKTVVALWVRVRRSIAASNARILRGTWRCILHNAYIGRRLRAVRGVVGGGGMSARDRALVKTCFSLWLRCALRQRAIAAAAG